MSPSFRVALLRVLKNYQDNFLLDLSCDEFEYEDTPENRDLARWATGDEPFTSYNGNIVISESVLVERLESEVKSGAEQ